MLTQTSELAVKALVVLGLEAGKSPVTPKWLAERMDCSASYLAKILGMLVRSGILRSVRGAHGGVVLAMAPEKVTLLMIVEACQGLVIGNYCEEISDHREPVCAFHSVMKEIHMQTIKTLTHWTLADMLARPTPNEKTPSSTCRMAFAGCDKYYACNRK